MLTNPAFAEFTHTYGRLGYEASKEDRVYLARLYWFTVEFGLLRRDDHLRIYGGGFYHRQVKPSTQSPAINPFIVRLNR